MIQKLKTDPPTAAELDEKWSTYVKASEKLRDMEHRNSKASEGEIQKQDHLAEKLLQDWVDGARKFKTQLN